MSEIKLNLARKWRSKTFNEIVGQELSVRMLKNGLFLQQYFPVYLFSGQRGCGKTTTARVFASALNCEKLSDFQKNPQKATVPCLSCTSCNAMQSGTHPDFIEIDAASHTGVDNVRYIIDSATLMPLMGNKKIYLIDEAHMLSKAAFNAFLKILEEPPASVLFILATTDPQKIIETVRSRCFQLFFGPVKSSTLKQQLQKVCDAERILYDDMGLETIIKQTEGSVRDALNMLEQVRFSSKVITQQAVFDVLGFIDDATLLALLDRVLFSSSKTLLQFLNDHDIKRYSMPMIWDRFLALLRAALWLKHGVVPSDFTGYHEDLVQLVKKCSVRQLQALLEKMYQYQDLFGKTTAQYDLFEMILLSICQKNDVDPEGSTSPSSVHVPETDFKEEDDEEGDEDDDESDEEEEEDDEEQEGKSEFEKKWEQVLARITDLNDPLVTSIFTQGAVQEVTDKAVLIQFSKQFIFFQELLEQTKHEWQPIVQMIFEDRVLQPLFTGATIEKKVTPPALIQIPQNKPAAGAPAVRQPARSETYSSNKPSKATFSEQKIDIADQETWKKTHMLLRSIPGSITELSSLETHSQL